MNAADPGRVSRLYMLLELLQIAIPGASAQAPPPPRTLIRAGHILDVETGAEPAAQTILGAGDRIPAIAATASAPKQAGDREIDLSRGSRMPGPIGVQTLPAQCHLPGDGVADGIAAVRQKVRQNIKYGDGVIQVCAAGGVLPKGDDPQASQYTREEMQAIGADARRPGRKVAAHAHGARGVPWPTDDAGIAALTQHGTYLVPTAQLIDRMRQYGNPPVFYQQKRKEVSAVEKHNATKAIKPGVKVVKVALGTDAAVYPPGLNVHEVDLSVSQSGMAPLAAIRTGTIYAADRTGWTSRTGTLQAGKWADMMAVDGDPLKT